MPAKKVRRFNNTKKPSLAKKSRVIIKKSPLPVIEEGPPVITSQPELVVESVLEQEIVQSPVENIPVENIIDTSQPILEETKEGSKEMDFLYPGGANAGCPEEPIVTKKSSSMGKVLVFFFLFILGVVIGGLVMYFYKTKGLSGEVKNQPAAEQLTPTLVPTEVPVDLKQYSISILNGSLVKGGAAKLKTELDTEGFNVTATGNATSSAFKETIIRAKKSVGLPYLEKLQTSLSKQFILGSTETLPDTQKTDVVITIGGKTP